VVPSDLKTLRAGYLGLKRDPAADLDGETWRHYAEQLEENLRDLSHRLKRRAYPAKPVRKVYVTKTDGGRKLPGGTALEHKLVQRSALQIAAPLGLRLLVWPRIRIRTSNDSPNTISTSRA
jgi:hypothetical protein